MPNFTGVLDPNIWKLTLPVGAKGKPTELSGSDLLAYESDYCRPTVGGVRFRAPVNGVTTPNSKNCRSELRELKPDGKSLASWSSTDATPSTLLQDMAFTRLPTGNEGVGVVGGQIHDSSDDVAVWRCESSGLWLAIGDKRAGWKLIDPAYKVGARITTAFVVQDGKIAAWYNGRKVHEWAAKFTGGYFRAGAYTQANAGAEPFDSSNYGETVYYSVNVVHGPVPAIPGAPSQIPAPVPQPDPVPVPVPAVKPVIMISRHGEKDDDRDGDDDTAHELSERGWDRAQAYPDLFLPVPKAGLYRPTWIFASKGASSSQRMVQTVQETADRLNLPVDTRYDSEKQITQTAQLLTDRAKTGDVVLAVLEHSAIPAVASAVVKLLGGKWNAKTPSSWPDARFDMVYVFAGDGKGDYTFSVVDQALLPGDKGYTAPQPPPVEPSPPPSEPPVPPPPPVVEVPVPEPTPQPEPAPQPQPEPTPPSRPAWVDALLQWLRRWFIT